MLFILGPRGAQNVFYVMEILVLVIPAEHQRSRVIST